MIYKQPVVKKEQPKREVKPKVPGVESQLVGKRLTFRSLDWSKAIIGTLKKVEKYLYVVDTDKGTLVLMKHSVGSISGASQQEENKES